MNQLYLPPQNHALLETLAAGLAAEFPAIAAPRAADSHKGSFGTALIYGGSAGMAGALALAASACQLLGAGKTIACFAQTALPLPYLPEYPEILLANETGELPKATAIAAGCGFDGEPAALARVIEHAAGCPLVLDAGALNLLAKSQDLQTAVSTRNQPAILTPHPAEAARLLGINTEDVQRDREQAAREIAGKYQSIVALKGHETLLADTAGNLHKNTTGNAGLAAGGTGDVLTGMTASLLAQGFSAWDSAKAAVYLHGAAAELLGSGRLLAGLLAGEVAAAARLIRHESQLKTGA